MRAQIILTSFIAGLGAAQSTVDPLTYDINNDPFHEELSNLTVANSQDSHIAAESRWGFRVVSGTVIVAGYTLSGGSDRMREIWESCFEHQGGNVKTKGDCIKASADFVSAYAILGVAGYGGQTALIGLLTGEQGLANTVHGMHGQGPNTKRETIDYPLLQKGVSNISDSNIDLMNHAIAVGRQQQKEAKPDSKLRQRCPNNNSNMFRQGHYFRYLNGRGMKLQCKPGCGQTGWNGRDMTIAIDRMNAEIMLHYELDAQFTVYNNNNGRVYARCKMTFLGGPSDTCPEFITGQGCNF